MIVLIVLTAVSVGASVGYVIGRQYREPSSGLWFGALLGPIGWLLVWYAGQKVAAESIEPAPEPEPNSPPAEVRRCPNGHEVTRANKYCPTCGTALELS